MTLLDGSGKAVLGLGQGHGGWGSCAEGCEATAARHAGACVAPVGMGPCTRAVRPYLMPPAQVVVAVAQGAAGLSLKVLVGARGSCGGMECRAWGSAPGQLTPVLIDCDEIMLPNHTTLVSQVLAIGGCTRLLRTAQGAHERMCRDCNLVGIAPLLLLVASWHRFVSLLVGTRELWSLCDDLGSARPVAGRVLGLVWSLDVGVQARQHGGVHVPV